MAKNPVDNRPVAADEHGAVWIIIGKSRHKIVNEDIYNQLFERSPETIASIHLDGFAVSFDVCPGSVLARGEDSLDIFLVTGYPITKKHKIENYETFKTYGFKMDAVRHVPVLIMEQVPLGPSISI